MSVLVALAAGCDDGGDRRWDEYCGDGRIDIDEECDSGGGPTAGCTADCRRPWYEVTAHWSFETLSGDVKAPCLAGNPPVRIGLSGGVYPIPDAACATGQAQVMAKAGFTSGRLTSEADHLHWSNWINVSIYGPGDRSADVRHLYRRGVPDLLGVDPPPDRLSIFVC